MRRALVVDDDKTILMITSQVLKNLGLQVETAADAHQALRMLKLLTFDLIVTDANMPSLSGFELLEIVKRNEKNFGSPKIVMLTGRTAQKDHDLAITAGAHKFLRKPVVVDQLKEAVTDLLGLDEIRVARDGINVSERVRWMDAFEILRVYEDGVEFTAPVLLRAGLQLDIGSRILAGIAPAFVQVEVTNSIAGRRDGEFLISAKFRNVQIDDRERMAAWLEAERKAS